MNLLWEFYWPMITAALVAGVIAGALAFRATSKGRKAPARKRKRNLVLAAGISATLLVGWTWHEALGTGERFASSVERQSRRVLVDWEMAPVRAVMARDPLTRTLILSGPADDFQRAELVRILDYVPGVTNVRWADSPETFTLPMLPEAELTALASFGIGLVLAYLLELRRRSRAQWRW